MRDDRHKGAVTAPGRGLAERRRPRQNRHGMSPGVTGRSPSLIGHRDAVNERAEWDAARHLTSQDARREQQLLAGSPLRAWLHGAQEAGMRRRRRPALLDVYTGATATV